MLIENRGAEPGGMGEPPLGPAAAAAGNAICDADRRARTHDADDARARAGGAARRG